MEKIISNHKIITKIYFKVYFNNSPTSVRTRSVRIEENDSVLWCSLRFSIGTIVVSGLYIAIGRYYAQERATNSHLC